MRKFSVLTICASAALALAAGCDNSVAVGNSNPAGIVSGIVLDASNAGAPLAAATVTVFSAGVTGTAMTDMNGAFVIKNVPSGNVIVTISNMGYVTAEFSSFLNGAVGNFPVKNPSLTIGPIGLIKSSGAFNVRLVDEMGSPVGNVKVTGRVDNARWVDYSSGSGFGSGAFEASATSGPDGLVQFMGLPDVATVPFAQFQQAVLSVNVPPVKIMNTEAYEFLGIIQGFNLLQLGTQVPTITLAGPHTPLGVVESNVPYLAPTNQFNNNESVTVPANGPLSIEFNQAINPQSLRVAIYEEDGVTLAMAQAQATVLTNIVTVMPSTPLNAGTRYNFLIHADSLNSATGSTVGGSNAFSTFVPMFTAPPMQPVSIVQTSIAKNTQPSGFTTVTFSFDEPVGLGDASTNAISCVAFYEGANLDNGDPASYPGEYDNNGAGLVCMSPQKPFIGLDITAVQPNEIIPPGIAAVTGFAAKWTVTINGPLVNGNSPGCSPNDPASSCAGPQSGNKIHLIFSRLPASQTIHRVNGQPLTDDPTHLVFTIP